MSLRAQYPVAWRRGRDFDIRAKWFTAIYDEIRKRIPTRLIKFPYVPSSAIHALNRWQLRLMERPDRVTHIISNMHSFLLRPHARCPTVISCYDLGPRWTAERMPFADRILASSFDVKRELESLVRLPREPEVVYLAVPPVYRPADLPRVPDRILFVGTEQKRKNVEGLFRILARVVKDRPATLVKVGQRSGNRARLLALARELGIDRHVVWRDFVPEEELVGLYQTSTVAVVPSFLEGFSMPCLEAMSTGCPLVASNVSSIPEVVGDGGLLLDPRDEAAWADGILRIFQDPRFATELSRRAQERSKAFSAERSAAQVMRVYEEVWAERGGA